MLQHAGFNEIANANTLEPAKAIIASDRSSITEQSVLEPAEAMLTADDLIERVEQLQLMYAMYQRKVILKDPHSPSKFVINDGSEYEGSDEQSPLHRKDVRVTKRPQSGRPQSGKLPSASRPDSGKAKPEQASLKKTSKLLLDALLSGQGCPGPAIQAEALELAQQGQLNCLLRLSVFIWPVWLDDRVITAATKLNAHAGVVLQMSHQEVIQQLNSLCQAQESSQHKGTGQNDATIQHMASVCVQRCSELLRSRDFQTTKQILQKTTQLTRRIVTTVRTQLKLLPLKLIAAMLHIGDGNIRDAVFELRSAIESIPLEHDSVKPYITTDVALLYNHLSYYYSLLGSRVEACRYTKMGIEVMAECKATMARSDMASQSLSVDEISARHMYIDAVLMMNQVVAEVSNEHSSIDAAKALCSDAVMFLEEVGTSTACVSHLTDRLQPLFENIQRVLGGEKPATGSFSPGATLSGDGGKHTKFDLGKPTSSKGNIQLQRSSNDGIQKMSGRATCANNSSARAKQSKLDLSASFGVVRSHSQISSSKVSKTNTLSWVQTPVAQSRPPSGVRSKPASPNTRGMHGNSKFKMLMLGPALAKGKENHPIPSFMAHAAELDERPKLPESLIRALFPPSFNSSKKLPLETTVSFDACSPDIFNVEFHEDPSPQVSDFLATHVPTLDLSHASENDDANGENRPSRIEFHPSKSNIRSQSSVNHIKHVDIDSLRLCCSIMKSFTCSFDSLEEPSQQWIKLAAHCASKLACEICYLFKLEGKSPDSTSAKTLLSSGKYLLAHLAQGGILTTQMNRFLQNGVLMRQVAILDEDNFTEANDELDRAILPIHAAQCSILMGVIPGNSQFNKISGFMIAIRSPPAASFDPEELVVCELLCNCCSQSLPLL